MQQTAIVTGASQGIGAAIAFALANENTYTILLGRNVAKLKTVAESIFKRTSMALIISATLPSEVI